MRLGEAKELFRQLTKTYFAGANVIFSNQPRTAKPDVSLVVITTGNVKRPHTPNQVFESGYQIGYYQTKLPITVDLFTHGSPLTRDGTVYAYENNALEDMLAYADFLNSDWSVSWCHEKDITLLIDGDVTDLTGVVNDTSYEFRSRMTVNLYFTQVTVGATAVLDEASIQYPTGNLDEEPDIVPKFAPTDSGGGTQELANERVGYYTNVEIKEESVNE